MKKYIARTLVNPLITLILVQLLILGGEILTNDSDTAVGIFFLMCLFFLYEIKLLIDFWRY